MPLSDLLSTRFFQIWIDLFCFLICFVTIVALLINAQIKNDKGTLAIAIGFGVLLGAIGTFALTAGIFRIMGF